MPAIKIYPSLLAADMGNLADACRTCRVGGADGIHLDIMDGHFVPNISMGPSIAAMADRAVDIHMHTHLMVTHPQDYIQAFRDAGADTILIHVESRCDVTEVLAAIRGMGARAGITLNPETPASAADPYIEAIDEILFMTVHPGFGGQSFMPDVLDKVRSIRDAHPNLELSVDGGINDETAAAAASAGINAFIAGTHLFGQKDMKAGIDRLRTICTGAYRTEITPS